MPYTTCMRPLLVLQGFLINSALFITFANEFIDKFAVNLHLCADDANAIGLLLLPLPESRQIDQSSITSNILQPVILISGAWLRA